MKNEKRFNKLVRDLIPEIIESKGEKVVIIILNQDQYRKELIKKLFEEGKELKLNPCVEEVADVLEVLDSICEEWGFRKEDVIKIQSEKRLKRGGFKKKIYLKRTYED
jgi:predicted house-cleaning noncanonical NTP pyrophosphatase (MazG superfamily)